VEILQSHFEKGTEKLHINTIMDTGLLFKMFVSDEELEVVLAIVF
jgi:hypothetical protein